MRETHRLRHLENSERHSNANRDAGDNHQDKIGCWSRQSHPRGATRIAALPGGIVRRIGPSDHPVRRKNVGQYWHNHNPKWRAADVRQRIQTHLSAMKSRGIAAQAGDERMRSFVARRREKKNDVPDQAESKEFRSHAARKTKSSTRVPQAHRTKISIEPLAFAVQTGMLDSAKRSCWKKIYSADRRSVELRALCNDSPRTPPGPEGSNGSGSASCAADHPKFLLSPAFSQARGRRHHRMSYKVIARKYRPQTFAEIVGQQHVTRTLANAIESNRVAHAYIFSGVRGVGKTTVARILAKALNCAKGITAEPDNTCDSCREITAGTSLDVLEIDAASNRGIDQIRELREMVRYAPASSRYKVVILDEAHQLTDEASNALLKTLEEPPERVVFILATTRAEDLVETIKSRAQLFQFRSLTFQEISGQIERIVKSEDLKIEPGSVAVLARAAEGSLRDGLSLLEQAIAYAGDAITDAQVRELLGVVAESVLDDLVAAIAAQSAERA